MGEPSDRELYLAASDGDRAAFERLAERHHGFTLRVALGHVGDRRAAEDVAHKAWLNVIRHLQAVERGERAPLHLEHKASLLAWLKQVVSNVAKDEFRRGGRETASEIDDGEFAYEPDFDRALEAEEARSVLWAALQRISDRCRELLMLFLHDPPLTYDDIARVLDRPIGSIGPTRARCLAQLRTQLEVRR